jgi:hypothetical protein
MQQGSIKPQQGKTRIKMVILMVQTLPKQYQISLKTLAEDGTVKIKNLNI